MARLQSLPARRYTAALGALAACLTFLAAGCTSTAEAPPPPKEPPASLAGFVRPATLEEAWAVARGHHEVRFFDDMFVATKDLRTTGGEGPITIIFPRDPRNPDKAIKWLGGPVDITSLLFEAKVQNTPETPTLSLEQGLLYQDPLCQSLQISPLACDAAPYERRPGSYEAMQSRLKPTTPDTTRIQENRQVPAPPRTWLNAQPGDMTLSPPKDYASAQTIVLESTILSPIAELGKSGTKIVGGELGANVLLVPEGHEGAEAFKRKYVYDAFCVPSPSGDGPLFPLRDWHMFLPQAMIEHIGTSCITG